MSKSIEYLTFLFFLLHVGISCFGQQTQDELNHSYFDAFNHSNFTEFICSVR